MDSRLTDLLASRYGAPESGIRDLRSKPTPDHIRYLDLMGARGGSRVADAVVEVRGEPVSYAIDAVDRQVPREEIALLARTLALRADAPYLSVLEPGRLTIHRLSFAGESAIDRVEEGGAAAPLTFQRLSLAPPWKKGRDEPGLPIEERLFELLHETISGLCDLEVDPDDALSLAGRALFTRFLSDRGIVQKAQWKTAFPTAESPEDFLSNADRAFSTCAWLDRTFNGDFLPIALRSRDDFRRLDPDVFARLSSVMRRSPGGQLEFSWAAIDFAHVPAGVLSQVYEQQAQRKDAAARRAKGVFYTPRRIADFMVGEAFANARDRFPGRVHELRVLDPAVGGGVFLVAAFKELVAAWWRAKGRQPNSAQLRQILYRQLAGFDIHEPAIRLTALSLYLTALELDPAPTDLSKLAFAPLRDQVLFCMGGDERNPMGSLDPAHAAHDRAFDVVLGNPPWTAWKRAGRAYRTVVDSLRPLVEERLGPDRAAKFHIPDRVPDVAFLWRAMRWAKPGGVIAFALHARLIFKNTPGGQQSRDDVFDALHVTGVLNGADLAGTRVWPGTSAPFCLVFANNLSPPNDAAFHFVSPYRERALNDQGRLRIDAKAAQPVEPRRMRGQRSLLKSLFRGTALDVEALERLQAGRPTLEEYWQPARGLYSGDGFIVGTEKNRTRPAKHVRGLPHVRGVIKPSLVIDTRGLSRVEEAMMQWPRDPDLYKPPLLLVREAPPSRSDHFQAFVSFAPLAYTDSFIGFSAHGAKSGDDLVRYLALVFNSSVFLWRGLLTSSRFGVERPALLQEDIYSTPVTPWEELSRDRRTAVRRAFDALANDPKSPSSRIAADDVVFDVYGVSRRDRTVIRDTLAVGLPFPQSRRRAEEPPRREAVLEFARHLQSLLKPFAEQLGRKVVVSAGDPPPGSPWQALSIAFDEGSEPLGAEAYQRLLDHADELGATEVVVHEDDRLLLGILREGRYWTESRARLCAIDLLERRFDHLGVASS